MRLFMRLLIAVALGMLLAPATTAQAAPAQCDPNDLSCLRIQLNPNHICYLPRACEVPLDLLDERFDPPQPTQTPVSITLRYDVVPVSGVAHSFVPVRGAQLTIPAGA